MPADDTLPGETSSPGRARLSDCAGPSRPVCWLRAHFSVAGLVKCSDRGRYPGFIVCLAARSLHVCLKGRTSSGWTKSAVRNLTRTPSGKRIWRNARDSGVIALANPDDAGAICLQAAQATESGLASFHLSRQPAVSCSARGPEWRRDCPS